MGKEFKPSTCKDCGEKLMWVKGSKGGNVPIDYDEDLESEFAGPRGTRPDFDGDRMTCHFDTCAHPSNQA